MPQDTDERPSTHSGSKIHILWASGAFPFSHRGLFERNLGKLRAVFLAECSIVS